MIDAANSGMLVPTDTTVTPMSLSPTPRVIAKSVAPVINISEPPHKPTLPNINNVKVL